MKIIGTEEELEQLYANNKPFREYVDTYCKSREKEKNFALQTQAVKGYAMYIIESEADKVKEDRSSFVCEDRDPDGDLLTSCKCDC